MPTVDQILNVDIPDPSFSYRPSVAAPLGSGMTYSRSGDSRVLTTTNDIALRGGGEPRIFGPNQRLLIEDQRTNYFDAPRDLTDGAWTKESVTRTNDAGIAKTPPGASSVYYDTIFETTDDDAHRIYQSTGADFSGGEPFTVSALVQLELREWCYIDGGIKYGSTFESIDAFFDLANGETGSVQSPTNATVLEHSLEHWGNDWYFIKLAVNPDSTFYLDTPQLGLSTGDGTSSYPGDTSNGARILSLQAEKGKNATMPIFETDTSNGTLQTRNNDLVTIPAITDWNDEEGTWIVDFEPRLRYSSNGAVAVLGYDGLINTAVYFADPQDSKGEANLGDNNNFIAVTDAIVPYKQNRIVVTFDSDEMIVASDGKSASATHNGNLLENNDILLGDRPASSFGRAPHLINSIQYIPSKLTRTNAEILS